ncbi:MAG TPA: OsmC family protein [Luteibaculaceae bacterium]|nr:OsmC family protein [Luteibaculaceae bacterium]
MKITLERANHAVAFTCRNADGQSVTADANAKVGGEGLGMRPMEMLLSALISCSSIDIILILKKMRIELSHYQVEVTGERAEGNPAPFTSIHLQFFIGKQDPLEQVEKAVALGVEKYCSVGLSLHPDIEVRYTVTPIDHE